METIIAIVFFMAVFSSWLWVVTTKLFWLSMILNAIAAYLCIGNSTFEVIAFGIVAIGWGVLWGIKLNQ